MLITDLPLFIWRRQVREGAELLVKSSNNEDVVTVLREIAAGRVVSVRKEKPENK